MSRTLLTCFCLLLLGVLYAQNPEGTYELVLEYHSKQLVTIKKDHTFEEIEHRWREGRWAYKCTYSGSWSVSGDSLILRPKQVLWHDKHVTVCREQDDNQQPGCCFSVEYFFDDKNIWNFGPISKSKFLYEKVKTDGK